MGKKALCLIFAFLLSIESFAAVVSDNDGSAFITKAEFEAMKLDFNQQIDNYNASIDNKIDGAIASYLNGVRLSKPFYTKSNIKEIHYPLQIIHHIKRFEECDDNMSLTSWGYNEDSLWSPKWNIMSVNVRGNYRIFDKTIIPGCDNVGTFLGGNYEDTSANGGFKTTCMTTGFEKTCNLFFQIDGWGKMKTDDPATAEDNTLLAYYMLADDAGSTGWGGNPWGTWYDRSSQIKQNYRDTEVYNVLDQWYSMTTASSKQTRANNKTHISFQSDLKQLKCDNENLFIGPNHTSVFKKDGMSQDLGSIAEYNYYNIIYNNNDGTSLAPVSYYNSYTVGTETQKKWDIYYTNKRKNRKLYLYDNTAVTRSTWAFWNRSNDTTGANYGIAGVVTRGYNLESELENTTEATARAWYKKSLIKQSRLKYDFSTDNKSFNNHKMGNGIPIYYFDKKELNGSEIDEIEIDFNMQTSYPSNKKYILFSKKPITVTNYAENVDSNPDFEKIVEFNGTKYTTDKRKIELVNGVNKIKLKDFVDGDVIYYKILWNTTNTKGGTNYDDESIQISNLELIVTL